MDSGPLNGTPVQLAGEGLIWRRPADFKVAARVTEPGLSVTELVPEGESLAVWSERITVTIDRTRPDETPQHFLQAEADVWKRDCPLARTRGIRARLANGYNDALLMMTCPSRAGASRPETQMWRSIQGEHGLYSVRYAFPEDNNQVSARKARVYVDGVVLCEGGSRAHPCPEVALAPGSE
jgi:hypothetical protein